MSMFVSRTSYISYRNNNVRYFHVRYKYFSHFLAIDVHYVVQINGSFISQVHILRMSLFTSYPDDTASSSKSFISPTSVCKAAYNTIGVLPC